MDDAAAIERLAKVFFAAGQRHAKEIDPDGFYDVQWDDESETAERGREVFRVGIRAVLADALEALRAENERLRAALEKIASAAWNPATSRALARDALTDQ